MQMNTNILLIIFSVLVIFSYIFEILSKKTHIPSVLLLLTTGIIIKLFFNTLEIQPPDLTIALSILGSLGLILIVLEGALDLKFDYSKRRIIIRAFFSSLFILVITTIVITFLFQYITNNGFMTCILNAIPFSIISSAIAIPSTAILSKAKREFIIYESTFSDILGIIFFNLFLYNKEFGLHTFTITSFSIIITIVVSVILCYTLVYLLQTINHHIKFFLILSVIILAYSFSKALHLSALIIVFVIGLFLNNIKVIKPPFLKKTIESENFNNEISQMSFLTAESSFLVRTFFFLIFGYIININSIFNTKTLLYGFIIISTIYFIRYLYLYFFNARKVTPEVYITPRGLISILLFFNIPADKIIFGPEDGILFLVIIITCIIMAIGIINSKK